MLESKYLTKDGIQLYLKTMYDLGFNFLFYNPDDGAYTISEQEPNYRDVTFMYCDGRKKHLTGAFAKTVSKELLDGRNYIAFEDYVDCTDWSRVPVDTLVKVKTPDGVWRYKYFAKYENKQIHVFSGGATSITSLGTIVYKDVKLAK